MRNGGAAHKFYSAAQFLVLGKPFAEILKP